MPERIGYGEAGLKNRPKLTKDILALRDKAKRKRKAAQRDKDVTANTASNIKRVKAGKKPRTLSERDLDKFRSPYHRKRRLQIKAAEMRAKADEVDRSGTGNKKAAATFRRAATEYIKQANAVKVK